MCGRYALYGPISRVNERLLLVHCPEYAERYNIAPQSDILVVRLKPGTGRVGQLVRWGLVPAWAQNPEIGRKLTNARSESVADKPAFRSSFAKHRCLIPASGFYEWQTIGEGRQAKKQPYFILPDDPGELFAFAGLLAVWRPPQGEPLVSTCIVTTSANEILAPIHDRMPVIIPPRHYDAWLDPANADLQALHQLLHPAEASLMHAYPVSPKVNSGRLDGPQCLEPATATPANGKAAPVAESAQGSGQPAPSGRNRNLREKA